jgi:conjugative transfer signal peptidase TraF
MANERSLPLLGRDDALRTSRQKRHRLLLRKGFGGLFCVALGATTIDRPTPRLVWNASASAPVGLYRVTPAGHLVRGDMVIARMPAAVRALAAHRGYIPVEVPLVKRVAAVAGDRVCAWDSIVTIGRGPRVVRRARDGKGRPLPWWRGCRTLPSGATFLLMANRPDSFDGRYFGPSAAGDIVGKATLLWAR